jgi:hypothetical protein
MQHFADCPLLLGVFGKRQMLLYVIAVSSSVTLFEHVTGC